MGLGGGWGQVTAGRQTNLLADAISPVDPVGMRFASFNPNIATAALSSHGLGVEYGAAGSTSGSYRLDNALKYSGRFGPLTARAMYSFGENTGRASAQSSVGAGLSYTNAGWVVSGRTSALRRPASCRCKPARWARRTSGAACAWPSTPHATRATPLPPPARCSVCTPLALPGR